MKIILIKNHNRKKMNKKILTVILIIIFLLSFIYNNKLYIIIFILHYKKKVPWYSDKELDKKKVPPENLNWMSKIKDSTDIRELSIPGTHDSCASYFIIEFYKSWWANFQSQ